jgi:predicted nuclease of predicted toxin-antitoxin system
VTNPTFKVDENLDVAAAGLLRDAGYDAETVKDEALGGQPDPVVTAAGRREGRCFVTLDLDFSNILDMPPEHYAGIVVLRHPRLRLRAIQQLIRQLIVALEDHSPAGQLWVVEPGRIRVHQGLSRE